MQLFPLLCLSLFASLQSHGLPCYPTGGPGSLKVETSRHSINVEYLTRKEQTREKSTLHGFEIDFFEVEPAAGYEFFFKGAFASDFITP